MLRIKPSESLVAKCSHIYDGKKTEQFCRTYNQKKYNKWGVFCHKYNNNLLGCNRQICCTKQDFVCVCTEKQTKKCLQAKCKEKAQQKKRFCVPKKALRTMGKKTIFLVNDNIFLTMKI